MKRKCWRTWRRASDLVWILRIHLASFCKMLWRGVWNQGEIVLHWKCGFYTRGDLKIQSSVCGQIVHRRSLHCGIRAAGDTVAPTEKKKKGMDYRREALGWRRSIIMESDCRNCVLSGLVKHRWDFRGKIRAYDMDFRSHQADETSSPWTKWYWLRRWSSQGALPKHIEERIKMGWGRMHRLPHLKQTEKGIENNGFSLGVSSKALWDDGHSWLYWSGSNETSYPWYVENS